jgi:hypothetical protein
MLAVVSAALLGKMKVETQSGLLEEPAVWMAPALPSGERKTTTQRLIVRPVYGVQRERMEAVAEQLHDAEAEVSVAERGLKAIEKREDASAADLSAAFRELDRAKAAVPGSGRIIADDVTPEVLLKLFGDSEQVFIAASEGGLLDTVTGIRYGKGVPNLDLLNKSHDGDPHSPARATRELGMIERPLLAMAVSPQPDVLRELASNETFGRRGTLARFLFSLPPSVIGTRAERTEPLDVSAMAWWRKFVHDLFDAAPVGEGIERISPQGQRVIEEWRRPGSGLEARAAHSVDPRLRAFRSRLHGEVYRLAVLLHFLRHGATGLRIFIAATGRTWTRTRSEAGTWQRRSTSPLPCSSEARGGSPSETSTPPTWRSTSEATTPSCSGTALSKTSPTRLRRAASHGPIFTPASGRLRRG